MANKYHNEINEYDGNIFDSLKERRRYQELKLLERAGEIRELKVHPQYEIHPGFVYNGEKIKPIYYEADFEYIAIDSEDLTSGEKEHLIIEEVKGMKTAVYKLKRKMLLKVLLQGIERKGKTWRPEFMEILV